MVRFRLGDNATGYSRHRTICGRTKAQLRDARNVIITNYAEPCRKMAVHTEQQLVPHHWQRIRWSLLDGSIQKRL